MANLQDILNKNSSTGGPTTPDPVRTEFTSLSVPTDVPVVQPVDVVPPNVAEYYKLKQLNGLGSALGVSGGIGGLGAGLAKAFKAHQDKQNLEQYHMGLLDATNQASGIQTVYSDLEKKGKISPVMNPYRQMGQDTVRAMNISSQYDALMAKGRAENPTKDPTELASEIRQQLGGQLSSLRPEMAYEFGLKPMMGTDKADINLYRTNQAKVFEEELANKQGGTIGAAITGELTKIDAQASNIDNLAVTVKTAAENLWQTAVATGQDLNKTGEAILGGITAAAQGAGNEERRTAILNTARNVMVPKVDGSHGEQPLLSIPHYAAEFNKARKAVAELDTAESTRRDGAGKSLADSILRTAYSDAAHGGLKDAEVYLNMAGKENLDVSRLTAGLAGLKNTYGVATPGDTKQDYVQNHVMEMVLEGRTVEEIQRFVMDNSAGDKPNIKPGAALSLIGNAEARVNDRDNAKKAPSYNTSILQGFVSQISISNPADPTGHKTAYEAGFNPTQGYGPFSTKVKAKWEVYMRSNLSKWVQEQSNSGHKPTQAEIDTKTTEIYNQDVKPGVQKDNEYIRSGKRIDLNVLEGNYWQPKGSPKSPNPHPASPAKTPTAAKFDYSLYHSNHTYAVDKSAYKAESLLLKDREGQIWKDWHTWMLRRGLTEAQINRKFSLERDRIPESMLDAYEQMGYPTHRTKATTPLQQPKGN